MNASNSCGHGHMFDRTSTFHIWVRDAERMADMNERALIRASFHVFQPIFAIWFNAEAILLMLQQEPEIARLAGLYLKYVSIGLPAYAFNSISRYALSAST